MWRSASLPGSGLRASLIALLFLLASGGVMELDAQEPAPEDTLPGDTLPPDALPADTLPADTLPLDTLPADTLAPEEEPARDTSPDAVMRALLELEGYTRVEYTGERAEFRATDRVLRLFGDPEIVRGAERLTARDTIVYRDATRMVEAYGEPRVAGLQADDITGEVMFYDLDRRRATVRGGRTQVAEAGASWIVAGEEVTAEGTDRVYVSRSTYTTDDRPEPQYHFQSDRVLVIQDRILVGRPARLYFQNVPVMWLPFIVQDMTEGRRSGILTPQFGINDIVRTGGPPQTERGTGRQISNIGFYWAGNEYFDAQFAGDWRSGVSTGLEARTRYRWRRQFLDGSLTLRRDWRDEAANVFSLNTSNSWEATERTRINLTGSYTSSGDFVRETNPYPTETTQDLVSNFSLRHRFDWADLSVGANRRQSIVTDRVEMTLPNVSLNLRPITLFRAPIPAEAQWFHGATLSLSGSGSRVTRDPGLVLSPIDRPRTTTRAEASKGFDIGNLSWSTRGNLNRAETGMLPGTEEWAMDPGSVLDDGRWESSLSYRQSLIGSTNISPNVRFEQQVRSDTAHGGEYVPTPLRPSVGAGLNTDLFGFFPGIGPVAAIRHRFSPRLSYSYAPAVEFDERQTAVFGERESRVQNRLQLSFNQTFEGRMRNGAADAAAAADTLPEGEEAPAAEREPQRLTLLSIDTSPLVYDFARAAEGEVGFQTSELSNTISSDYLRGLRLNFTHELFDRRRVTEPGDPGTFSPQMTRFTTSFSFGEGSGPVEFLLGLFDRGRETRRDDTELPPADTTGAESPAPGRGMPTATERPQAVGGPWNVQLNYSYERPRRNPLGEGVALDPARFAPNQHLDGNVSFAPTPNWAVNWRTRYSLTEREFGDHHLTLRRDLYRWEANFTFSRSAFGASLFSVAVRLKDLPDLKFEHREQNIGVDGARRQR